MLFLSNCLAVTIHFCTNPAQNRKRDSVLDLLKYTVLEESLLVVDVPM